MDDAVEKLDGIAKLSMIRFTAADSNPGDIVEAGVDGVIIRERSCVEPPACEPDLADPKLIGRANVRASNGMIQTINRVLLPVNLP